MLAAGRRRVERAGLGDRIRLVEGEAEELPFADASFDALTFTYLLRYVDDPPATLRELARVVRPGGTVAVLEFGVPRAVARRPGSSTCASGCRSPAAALAGLARGRALPRPEHPRVRRGAPGVPALWRDGRARRRAARRLSLGGGVVDLGPG